MGFFFSKILCKPVVEAENIIEEADVHCGDLLDYDTDYRSQHDTNVNKYGRSAGTNSVCLATSMGAANTRLLVSGSAKFTIDFYRKLSHSTQQNVFLSPASISIALALAYLGARGDTAKQMKTGMQFDGIPDEHLHGGLGAIQKQMAENVHKFKLLLANGLFVDKSYKFGEEYVAKAKFHYQVKLASTDFKMNPEKSCADINRWIEDKTENKISNVLGPGSVNSMTRLVLVNAIYFKADWAEKFQESRTREDDFFVNADENIKVFFMAQHGDFKYGYNQKLNSFALELPYVGYDISMFILLPKAVDGLGQLEAELSEEHLSDPEGAFGMRTSDVAMTIPRFQLHHKFDLNDTLRNMGMKDLFDQGKADLRSIGGKEAVNLFVSSILHDAFIKVNEEGSEAAAVTVIMMSEEDDMAPIHFEFCADHPFLFFIRYNSTKIILFLGRLYRPPAAR